jgi:hypothetical protein
MTGSSTSILQRALSQLMRPLARLMLRNGVSFGEFSELARRAYVQSALEDFTDEQRRTTDSRAAVLTGLTRKEVKRQREILEGQTLEPATRKSHRASRVVSGWVHDEAFQDGRGQPAELAIDGPFSFAELVRRYSGDMTPRAVLDELLRVGMVTQAGTDGKIRLIRKAYVPAGDSEEMLQIFGEDVADLIRTIDHNLVNTGNNGGQPLFQRTLVYDNIPPEIMARWRRHAAAQSQALLEQLDQWLAPRDRDISGQNRGIGTDKAVRTGVGIFYFEDPVQPGEGQE